MRCYVCDCPLDNPQFDEKGLAYPCNECMEASAENLRMLEGPEDNPYVEGEDLPDTDIFWENLSSLTEDEEPEIPL